MRGALSVVDGSKGAATHPMRVTRGTLRFLIALGVLLSAGLVALGRHRSNVSAQEQAPNRREFALVAKDFRFSPDRIEVMREDIVKLTARSEDVAYSVTIDEYRISKRVPAGGTVTFEFRADRQGAFPFYSNLTDDPRHAQMRGELVVRPR